VLNVWLDITAHGLAKAVGEYFQSERAVDAAAQVINASESWKESNTSKPVKIKARTVETSPRYVRQAGRARGRAREIRHLSRAPVRDIFVRRVSVRHASRSRRRRRRCHVGGKPRLYKIVISPSESIKSIKTAHALTFQQGLDGIG